jgi:hypothetical protein
MFPRTAALFVLIVAGCAGPQRRPQVNGMTRLDTGLYMGHSTNGEVVLAATHYDAMVGLATTDREIGLPERQGSDGQMLCSQETPTGTHVPRWICRYEEDARYARQQARDWLDRPELSFAGRGANLPILSIGRGPGTGNGRGTLAP